MAGRDNFYEKRRNQDGGRRSIEPPPDQGFGSMGAGYYKKAEKYDPNHLNQVAKARADAEASKEKKHHKTKFVNLYSDQGQERSVVKLPGRNECNCQASAHRLINNCLKCGRIVCEQEGSGSCFFCGSVVCSREEMRVLDQGGRKADELRQKLMLLPKPKPTSATQYELLKHEDAEVREDNSTKSKSVKGKPSSSQSSTPSSSKDFDKGLEKAVAEKDRLLEYQRNKARRTMVYDDESDYFTTGNNPWLTDEQREKLRKREAELRDAQNVPRSQRKITLDIAGRQVVDDQPLIDLYNPEDAIIQQIHFNSDAAPQQDFSLLPPDDIHRPGFFRPVYYDESMGQRKSKSPTCSESC